MICKHLTNTWVVLGGNLEYFPFEKSEEDLFSKFLFEKEEELKSLLMKVKEESGKVGLKLNIQNGEDNSKWSNWQTTNLENIQATPTAQLQKNKWPNQKMGQRTK